LTFIVTDGFEYYARLLRRETQPDDSTGLGVSGAAGSFSQP
jgi:hypothetical protein